MTNPTDTIIALEKALETWNGSDGAIVARPDLRALLDAHASALRDAERLKKALAEIVSASYDKSVRPLAVHLAVESARAALDDNTKGAAE